MVTESGQIPLNAIQREVASIAAVAKVFPKTIVASKSCASPKSRTTIPPLAGFRPANCRACHLLSEKSAVSASAKKKLPPAKINTTATATDPGCIVFSLMCYGLPPKSKLFLSRCALFTRENNASTIQRWEDAIPSEEGLFTGCE